MKSIRPFVKKYATALRVLLAFSLFGILFYFYGEEARDLIAEADLRYVVIAFVVGLVDRVLMAYKWNILLRAKQIGISLWESTTTYLAASFLGLFLPATVGGDALRSYAVSKKGYPLSDVLSTVVVERLLGIVALILFGMGAIVLSVVTLQEQFFDDIWIAFWLMAALLIVMVGVMMMAMTNWFANLFSAAMERLSQAKYGAKVADILSDLYKAYASFRHNRGALAAFLGLSMLENCFPILWTYLMALALNIPVPTLYFFILVPIALIVHRLPLPTPDGWGFAELPYIGMLSLIGIPAAQGFLLGVATHLLTVAIILPGGIFYLTSGLRAREKELARGVALKDGLSV